MNKVRRLMPKYNRSRLIRAALVALGLVGAVLFVVYGRTPDRVWLPDNEMQLSDDQTVSLPIQSKVVTTPYGRAVLYAPTASRTGGVQAVMYEFRSNLLLRASACPNITHIETLSPSGCEKLGMFEGSAVYGINRRLSSSTAEYFVRIGSTFIYIKSGDGGKNIDYLQTFRSMTRVQAGDYLANNNKRVEQILAKQQAEKAATDQHEDLAYTRLDFTPAIPQTLPAGWELNTRAAPIEIDGPDADHPSLVNITYTNNRGQFVSLHTGSLSDFKVGTQCGPSPGHSMEYMACQKVAGTNYYEAAEYGEPNYFIRYLYYPVGDSLVISKIVVHADGDKRPDYPTDLAKIQDTITTSAKSVSKDTLKGSPYHRLYYFKPER